MAIVTVNRYASETSVVYNNRGLGLDVIWLWNSGRNPTVMLLPSTYDLPASKLSQPVEHNEPTLVSPWSFLWGKGS